MTVLNCKEVREALAEKDKRIAEKDKQINQWAIRGMADTTKIRELEANVERLKKEAEQLEAEKKAISDDIHYPGCWDTACYETLLSAIHELFASCGSCHEIDCPENETLSEPLHCPECGSDIGHLPNCPHVIYKIRGDSDGEAKGE